jgi:predicted MFS family arabinose efflux permease
MLAPKNVSRTLLVVMAASFFLNLAFGLNRAVFANFVGQELGISEYHYGLLEGIREVPGLLTVLITAVVASLAEERLFAACGLLMGAGIWLYASAHTYADLILATLIQSVGFHVWTVVQDSLVMKSVTPAERPKWLGQINSVAAGATLVGMGGVFLAVNSIGLRPFFLVAGIAGLIGAGVALLNRPAKKEGRRTRFVFRWQYRSYYILTMLQGARRHIVLTFASFALVKLFGIPATTMAFLLMAHHFLAIFTRPLIGRVIARLGEQRALALNYGIVAAIFLAYAFLRIPWLWFGLFILDNVMTGFDIAVSTHAGRIIPKAELSPSLAMGVTINHIFGVTVPVVGGLLWEAFGAQIPFLLGAGLALVSLAYSWNLDGRTAHLRQSA